MSAGRSSDMRLAVYRHQLGHPAEHYILRQADLLGPSELRLFGVTAHDQFPSDRRVCTIGKGGLAGKARRWAFQATRRDATFTRAIRSFGPDVVIAHFAQDAWRIAPTTQNLGVPLVVVCHGSDVLCHDEHAGTLGWSGRQLAANWGRLGDAASLFLPVSEFVADALKKRGIASEKVLTHYIGVDVPRRRPTWGPTSQQNHQIVFAGRLVENKGCDTAIRALALLRSEGLDVSLVAAGQGPQGDRLALLARQLKVADHVSFPGHVPRGELMSLMAQSVACLVPSRQLPSGISEGLGLVSLEAQAAGTPAIVGRTGGLPETVKEGLTGIAVRPDDEAAFASAVRELIVDPRGRKAMGEAAVEWVSEKFDITAQSKRLSAILETVVAENGPIH